MASDAVDGDMTAPGRRTARLLAIFCLAGFALSLAINFPGFMSYDSVEQILEARAGVYSDWHPPFMALLWHFTERLAPGPLGMLVLETAIIWLASFLIARSWFGRSAIFALAPCLLVFYPPIFGISGAIWKDIFMWAFLMLGIGFIGTIKPGLSTASRYTSSSLGLLSLLAALLVRHNAIFAVVPLVALMILRNSGGGRLTIRRLAGAGALGAVLLVGVLAGAKTASDALATFKTFPWQSLALLDIAGIVHGLPSQAEREKVYMSVPAKVRGTGSIPNLMRTYDPAYWMTLVDRAKPAFTPPPWDSPDIRMAESGLSMADRSALIHAWGVAVMQHPAVWFHHRLAVFKQVVGLTPGILLSPVFIGSSYPAWVEGKFERIAPLNSVQQTVKAWFDTMSRHAFYRPWVYLLLSALVILGCAIWRSMESLEAGLIAASGVAHEIGLLLCAPSNDFRYSHYMIYTSILALLLLLQAVVAKSPRVPRHAGG